MKILNLILLASVIAVPTTFAGYGTNSFFVNMEDGYWTSEKLANAKTNIECQPAENDQAGHWGKKIIGEQLSIRFAKDVFQTNEPVIATIIYRNTRTDRDLIFNSAFGGDLDFQFVIKDENGKELPDSFVPPARVSPKGSEWLPGTQYKYQSNLTKRYGLSKPGTYSISVHRKIRKDNGNGWSDLASGTATIVIAKPYK